MEDKTRNNDLLIIFYKNPLLGKVKTRLAATVGDVRALAIYRKLAEHTRTITQNLTIDKVIYYANYIEPNDDWSNAVPIKYLQSNGDLGERMQSAFHESFLKGYRSVCIIGTDCFELTSSIIKNAFENLLKYDVVLGPAQDGGYYLLGMKTLHHELFANKKWSSDSVASDTLQDFASLNLTYAILPTLKDVDTEADLPSGLIIP